MNQRIIDPSKLFQSTPGASEMETNQVDDLVVTKRMIETQKVRDWEEKLLRYLFNSLLTHDGKSIGKLVGASGSNLYLNEPIVDELKVFIVQKYIEEEAEAKKEETQNQPQPHPAKLVQPAQQQPQQTAPQNVPTNKKKRRRRGRGKGGSGNVQINSNKQ